MIFLYWRTLYVINCRTRKHLNVSETPAFYPSPKYLLYSFSRILYPKTIPEKERNMVILVRVSWFRYPPIFVRYFYTRDWVDKNWIFLLNGLFVYAAFLISKNWKWKKNAYYWFSKHRWNRYCIKMLKFYFSGLKMIPHTPSSVLPCSM